MTHCRRGLPRGQQASVPVLAKGRCTTGRLWAYVRDDQPFGGGADAGGHPKRQRGAAPAALFLYSPNRDGEHPERHLTTYTGLMQADAYAGYNELRLCAALWPPHKACWTECGRGWVRPGAMGFSAGGAGGVVPIAGGGERRRRRSG